MKNRSPARYVALGIILMLLLSVIALKNSTPEEFAPLRAQVGMFTAKYDFGTATSPIASGYTRVVHTTTYSSAQGYGWQSGTIDSRDRGAGSTDLYRDLNYTTDGTFAVDVPNGTYSVTITTGDYSYARDQQELSFEGVIVDTISVFGGRFVTRSYDVVVADGQLTMRFRDAGGANPVIVINELSLVQTASASSSSVSSSAPVFQDQHYDFGTATSPVAAEYTRIVHSTTYSATAGYGWLSGVIDSRDRGGTSDINRDLNFTTDGTFVIDVPNGNYAVTITSGDQGYARDLQELSLEGTVVDTITVAGGKFVTRTYTVAVNDGQLTLRYRDAGGANPVVVINELRIESLYSSPPESSSSSNSTVPASSSSLSSIAPPSSSSSISSVVVPPSSSSISSSVTSPSSSSAPTGDDTTAPVITSTSRGSLTSSSIKLTWVTNEASTTQIEYGTTQAYGMSSPLVATLVTSHSVTLTGLQSGTMYHFRMVSTDAAGNTVVSGNSFFKTYTPDTTAPIISAVTSAVVTPTGAKISWTTSEASTTQVEYGTTTAYGMSTALSSTMVTSHVQALTGLTPSTLYHYRVHSKDAGGRLQISSDYTITTPPNPSGGSLAPVIQPIADTYVMPVGTLTNTGTFTASATDPQSKPFTFSIQSVKKNGISQSSFLGMTINPQTGKFIWIPQPAYAGNYEVIIKATNTSGYSSTASALVIAHTPAICNGTDIGCVFLKQQYAAGLAAGNVGDYYHNRDGFHTNITIANYPALSRMTTGWGAELSVWTDRVVIGNSSTAYSDPCGSNVCKNLMSRGNAIRAYNQYRGNNHYMYPEHRDHDTVDFFHANFPYALASQGSSGSEIDEVQKFIRTLGAFRPEVKERLKQEGLLIPTLQMIFRYTRVESDTARYLSGEAHPTVYNNSDNGLAMIYMANEMRLEDIPPMVQLQVQEENYRSVSLDGAFDSTKTEKHFDTPASVSRIFRDYDYTKRMVVSAENSFDSNGRPLTYEWVVARGDSAQVRINKLNPEGSVVELLIDYHPETTVEGSTLLTNRVDIAAFAHNGVYFSAPAFVTSYTLRNEDRTYDPLGELIDFQINNKAISADL